MPRFEVRGKFERTNSRAVQCLHPITHSGQHTLDLMVFTFCQGEIQTLAVYSNASRGTHGFGVIIKYNARLQLRNLLIVHKMLGSHPIDLGNMLLRRTHAMDEMSIVTEQQKTCCVLVQTANSLHPLNGTLARSLP